MPQKIVTPSTDVGSAQIHVINTQDNNPIGGAVVTIGTESGTTLSNGNILIPNIPWGNYQPTVTNSGFVPHDLTNVVISNDLFSETVALSPEFNDGDLRMVLEWGDEP